MVVTERTGDRLVFEHDGTAAAQSMLWVVVACVGVVALAMALGGSLVAVIVVLAIGTFFVTMLRRSSARSTAVFDGPSGSVSIEHRRGDTVLERTEKPLSAIDDVIVEATSRSRRHDEVLNLRPALVVGADIVPLTWRAFVSGDSAVQAALAIRHHLGKPEAGLYEDSVVALARHTDRVNPAVRIARIGLGLGRREAADLVTRLKDAP